MVLKKDWRKDVAEGTGKTYGGIFKSPFMTAANIKKKGCGVELSE